MHKKKCYNLYLPIIIYIVLTILHIALVWSLPFFPTQDGPSHIYNLVILKDLLNGGKIWGDFYYYDLNLFPNLGFHIISYPLINIFDPIVVERVFLTIYVLMICSGVPFFIYEFNKKSIFFTFLVFPVVFNFPLMMGFYSYVISVPLFIIFFCVSWRIKSKHELKFLFFYNLMALILMCFHLIVFCFYMISIFSIFLINYFNKQFYKKLLHFILVMAPSLAAFGYYYFEITSVPGKFEYLSGYNSFQNLVNDLFFFTSINFSKVEILSTFPFALVTFFCLFLFIKDNFRKFFIENSTISNQRPLLFFLFFILIVYFFAPSNFGKGSFFNLRLPFVMLLVMLPLLKFPEKCLGKKMILFALPVVSILSFFTNVISLSAEAEKVKKYTSGIGIEIPEKSILMSYKERKAGFTIIDVLLHAASYYGIEKKSINIGNYEPYTNLFPVRLKKDDFNFPDAYEIAYEVEKINLKNYSNIEYLISWEIDVEKEIEISDSYREIFQDSYLKIWERKK